MKREKNMKIARTKNSVRNMYWGFINRIVGIVLPFVVRTVLLQKLGNEYLGLNSLFSSVLQILSVAELGIGNAIVFSMYRPIAEDDESTINALLKFYKKTYHIIGITILFIGIIILPFIGRLINGDVPSDVNIYVLYLIYLFNTSISYFMFSYKQSILLAFQRNDIDSRIQLIVNTVLYGTQIIMLLIDPCYYTYVIAIPISTIAINILRNWSVNKYFAKYHCEGSISPEDRHILFKRVFGMMLYKISYVFRNSFDSVIISSFLGLIVLAQYQNYYYIMNSVAGFLSIITSSITAGIGNSLSIESIKKNKADYMTFNLVFTWVSGWCAACFLCLYQDFITLWVGEDNRLSFILVILMCVYFYSLQVGNVCAVYREAAGLWWEDRIRPIVETLANLVMNIMFVSFFGVIGVVLATIISIIFINIPWATHILFKNYFKENAKPILMRMMRYAGMVVIVCALSFLAIFWVDYFIKNLILRLIIKALLCCIIPNIIFFFLFHKEDEFKDSVSLLKRVLGIKGAI